MTTLRTLITGVMAAGALMLATPAQAHDDHDRDRHDHYDRDYHHHHHRWHNGRETVIIGQSPSDGYVNDSGVTVAFGGSRRYHHYHH